MFDFRERFILFLFAQAILNSSHYVMGGHAPACFYWGLSILSEVTIFATDACNLYVESSEGGRGGLKRFVTVVG